MSPRFIHGYLAILAVCSSVAAGASAAQGVPAEESHEAAPTAEAAPLQGQIVVDGRLNEPGWAIVRPATEFTQLDPNEGEPASEPTEVRILFDAEALYVGARLGDSQPPSNRLARRDTPLVDSDWFIVALDSYHDHLTAFRFSINPAGVRQDDIYSSAVASRSVTRRGESEGDLSWDPVWEAKTTVTDSGWVAEMRIPFSQLRFSRADVQSWGIQLERRIARKQEVAFFAFTPKRERSGVARYGHLTGLRDIRALDRLEVLPYVLGQAAQRAVPLNPAAGFPDPFRSGSQFDGGLGADVKYRVTSNFTLDATLNPDFGQVEVDPAVINLTAFETRYEEKRPFFVEGADIFRFGASRGTTSRFSPMGGAAQLLYSRRIGRTPQLGMPGEAVYHDSPPTTTILGAAKMTGRTSNGWSIGLLDAVTQREEAPFIDADGLERRAVVEPLSNYFVGRAKRDFNSGLSTFGGIFSAVQRQLDTDFLQQRLRSAAYSAGVDFRHEWADRVWSVTGYLSPSYVRGSQRVILDTQRSSRRYFQRPDADHLEVDSTATSLAGYVAQLDIGKRAGAWQGNMDLTATSPEYEVNDLGFQTAADRITIDSNLMYEQTQPGSHFRRWSVRAGPDISWNFAGTPVDAEVSGFITGQWNNYWSTSVRLARNLPALNDRLTRGGPLTEEPIANSGFVFITTDPRKSYQGAGSLSFESDEAGGSVIGTNFTASLRLASNWLVSLGPEITRNRSIAQYISTVQDPTATHTFGRRYVFAPLDQSTVGIQTRVNVTFTPNLSFELYAQPFVSSGNYGDLKELAAPRTFRFSRYGQDVGTLSQRPDRRFTVDPDAGGPAPPFLLDDRDFNFRSLRGNAVLRWEWRPGSTLYLVWQQDRSEEITSLATSRDFARIGTFDLGRDTGELFRIRPNNILIIKFNYWLNP